MSVTHQYRKTNAEVDRSVARPFSVEATGGSGPATVLVRGELDAATAPELGDRLEEIARSGRDVDLDLSDTSFIDSAGIRVLVRSLWDVQAAGSSLQLVATSPAAENILRITGILEILKDPSS
jgi:anti-anti-sigma factor